MSIYLSIYSLAQTHRLRLQLLVFINVSLDLWLRLMSRLGLAQLPSGLLWIHLAYDWIPLAYDWIPLAHDWIPLAHDWIIPNSIMYS